MKKTMSKIVLPALTLLACGLLLYPHLSFWLSSRAQLEVVQSYESTVSKYSPEEIARLLQAAKDYNYGLTGQSLQDAFAPNAEQPQDDSNGLAEWLKGQPICTLYIPDIQVNLPVYYGCEESVLQIGAGLLNGTSLPIGGEGTHAVISAHRGLSHAKMFSDLDQLIIGDVFFVTTLDETRAYEVDQIIVAEPEDVEELVIVPGKDYVTLLTCTPYSINSHRLLVRGSRIPFSGTESGTPEIYEPLLVWGLEAKLLLISVLVIVGFTIAVVCLRRAAKRKNKK